MYVVIIRSREVGKFKEDFLPFFAVTQAGLSEKNILTECKILVLNT